MKKLILSLCLIFSIVSISFAEAGAPYKTSQQNEVKSFWKMFHVRGTITMSGGCIIAYDLYIDVSIFPPGFNLISGSLTMSGNCSGSQNINARGTVSENKQTTDFEVISAEAGKVNPVFTSKEFRLAMVKKLNEANLFTDENPVK
ncbi:hypothetical protein BH11BAC4_BH11BAC4_22710 [soil metagenome]